MSALQGRLGSLIPTWKSWFWSGQFLRGGGAWGRGKKGHLSTGEFPSYLEQQATPNLGRVGACGGLEFHLRFSVPPAG